MHGTGSYQQDYWREWAGNLLPELSAQGLALTEDHCNGVIYSDLFTHLKSEADLKADIELRSELEVIALREFGLQRKSYPEAMAVTQKWANAVVDNFGDIFAYLYHDQIHRAVNERVYESLAREKEPLTLISYSLGSLVSYCTLKEIPQAGGAVIHLIMAGSPLFWFKHGMAAHVDLTGRPPVGRFTNIAGMLDIAWPQKVPEILTGLDENMDFVIDPLNPIKGHHKYFYQQKSLAVIASAVIKGWG